MVVCGSHPEREKGLQIHQNTWDDFFLDTKTGFLYIPFTKNKIYLDSISIGGYRLFHFPTISPFKDRVGLLVRVEVNLYIAYPEDCDSCFLCSLGCPYEAVEVSVEVPLPFLTR